MGLAILAVVWLITFISTYFFVAQTWWLPAWRIYGGGIH